MRIADFIANLPGGGARNNLFRVILPFPAYSVVGGETSTASFLIKAAQLPASTLGTIEVPHRGRIIKLAGDRTFAEWTVTVLNDTDFRLRNAFERWSNGISSNETNVGRVRLSDYTVDIQVEQLDKNDEVIKSYTLKGAWPSEIAAIDLSSETQDAIEEFTVTFQYTLWSSNTTN